MLETSEAYSDPYQTSKLKLLQKYLKAYYCHNSNILYSEAYSKPCQTSKMKQFCENT